MTMTMTTQVDVGERAVASLERLAGWIDERSSAFCTGADWLLAAARHLAGTPVLITVGPAGHPTGLAALSMSRRHGIRRVSLLGGELNDYGALFHDDLPTAHALAGAVTEWLGSSGPWSLELAQLDPDDPALRSLVERLPGSRLEVGPPMPRIEGIGSTYVLSRNRRRSLRRATNRIESEGRTWHVVAATRPADVARWLPVIIGMRRCRDHAAGRRSHLDQPAMRSFYESFLLRAAESGRVVVDVLLVDDVPAGYTVTLRDRHTYRLFDGRVADEMQRYQGGIVCDVVAVTRAADDADATTFDWLRGRTDAKFGNDEIHRTGLHATSGRVVASVDAWAGAVRERAREAIPDGLIRVLVAR